MTQTRGSVETVKSYSVRKMGTRMGQPHYGAECLLCRSVLIVAHATKQAAMVKATTHVREVHGR